MSGIKYLINANNKLLTDKSAGEVARVTINAGGTGYTVDDVITLTGGNNDCTLKVLTVNAGVITSVSILTRGTGYSVADAYAVTGGTGNDDATIDINSLLEKLLLLNETYGRKYGYIAPDPIIHLDFDPQYVDIVNDSGTDYVTKAYNLGSMGSAMDFSNAGAYSTVPIKSLMPNGTPAILTHSITRRALMSGNLIGFLDGNFTILFAINRTGGSTGSAYPYSKCGLINSTNLKVLFAGVAAWANPILIANANSLIAELIAGVGTYVLSYSREISGTNEIKKIYVNGSIVTQSTVAKTTGSDTGVIKISDTDANQQFVGNIAKGLIYNRLLTDSEHGKTVQTLYNKYITI